MELTVGVEVGPIEVELTGEDREEVQEELLKFTKFLNENSEVFDSLGHRENNRREAMEGQSEPERDVLTGGDSMNSEVGFGDIPGRTGFNEEVLNQYFAIDPDDEEPPHLSFNPEALNESGSSRGEKQMRGSLILMTLWRECIGVEEVDSPDLKDALRASGIDDTHAFGMYDWNDDEGDQYFNREGSGSNTVIELSLPGRREGYDQVRRTLERIESGDGDE